MRPGLASHAIAKAKVVTSAPTPGNPSLLQNDPNAEPNAMTTASAKSALTIATMTILR